MEIYIKIFFFCNFSLNNFVFFLVILGNEDLEVIWIRSRFVLFGESKFVIVIFWVVKYINREVDYIVFYFVNVLNSFF